MGFSFRKASKPGPQKIVEVEAGEVKEAGIAAEPRAVGPLPVSPREWENTLKATEALLASEIGKSERSIRETVLQASGDQRTEIHSIIRLIDQRTIDRAELNQRRREAWKVISDSLAGFRSDLTQLAGSLKEVGSGGLPLEQLEGLISEIRGEGRASTERVERALSDLRDAQWARIEEMLAELRRAESDRVGRILEALKDEGEHRVTDVKQEGDKRVAAVVEEGERKLAAVAQEGDKRSAAIKEEGDKRAADLKLESERLVSALQAEGDRKLSAVKEESDKRVADVRLESGKVVSTLETEGERKLAAVQEESRRGTADLQGEAEKRIVAVKDAGDLRVYDADRTGDERVSAQREVLRSKLADLEAIYRERLEGLESAHRERIESLNRDRESEQRENRRHRREALMHLITLFDSVDAQLGEVGARLEAKEKQTPLEASPWPSGEEERKSSLLGRLFGKEEIRRLEAEREAREALAERLLKLEDDLLEGLRARRTALEDLRRIVLAALDREGVKPISSIGELFRPDHHQKVDEVALKNGRLPGTIIAERRRGFSLNGEILRPADVVVVKGD